MKEERREGMPVRPEPAGSGRKSLPYTEFRLSSADCADYADWPGGRAEGLRYRAAGAWTDREGEGVNPFPTQNSDCLPQIAQITQIGQVAELKVCATMLQALGRTGRGRECPSGQSQPGLDGNPSPTQNSDCLPQIAQITQIGQVAELKASA